MSKKPNVTFSDDDEHYEFKVSSEMLESLSKPIPMGQAMMGESFREFSSTSVFDNLANTIDPDKDMVNHPPHYNQFPFEVLAAIHTLLGTEGYKHYLLGNELKYRLRAGFKDKGKVQEDIDKALFYNKERKRVDSDSE